MDILNDILNTLNLQGAFYFRTDFSGKWGVTVPQYEQAARFHLVIQGSLVAYIGPQRQLVKLGPGDLILIPRGLGHVLSSHEGVDAPPLETLLDDLNYDGRGVLTAGSGRENAKTKLVCGHLSFRPGADHPVLNAMPDFLIVTPSIMAQNPILEDVTRMLIKQTLSGRPGSEAAIIRLSEIMFIELLRIGVDKHPVAAPILKAFNDPKIGRSIELIHGDPQKQWSVESLAREVGMSRSRFAKRFSDYLETGPMAYLADWRLQKALVQLEDSRMQVKEIAQQSGYKSSAAFTRAFTAKFNVSPSQYRRT